MVTVIRSNFEATLCEQNPYLINRSPFRGFGLSLRPKLFPSKRILSHISHRDPTVCRICLGLLGGDFRVRDTAAGKLDGQEGRLLSEEAWLLQNSIIKWKALNMA